MHKLPLPGPTDDMGSVGIFRFFFCLFVSRVVALYASLPDKSNPYLQGSPSDLMGCSASDNSPSERMVSLVWVC